MKKHFALPAIALSLLLGVAGCTLSSSEDSSLPPSTPIKLGPEEIPTHNGSGADMKATLTLQLFLSSLKNEVEKTSNLDIETMSYGEIKQAFPKSNEYIREEAVGTAKAESLMREYLNYTMTVPDGGFISLSHETLDTSKSGSVTVSGADLYVAYREGSVVSMQEGASLYSDASLNDVFVLSQVDGNWFITSVEV